MKKYKPALGRYSSVYQSTEDTMSNTAIDQDDNQDKEIEKIGQKSNFRTKMATRNSIESNMFLTSANVRKSIDKSISLPKKYSPRPSLGDKVSFSHQKNKSSGSPKLMLATNILEKKTNTQKVNKPASNCFSFGEEY